MHQGKIKKNTVVFIPLSDDYDDPSSHDAIRKMEDDTMQEEW